METCVTDCIRAGQEEKALRQLKGVLTQVIRNLSEGGENKMSDCCSVQEAACETPLVMNCPVSGTRSKQVAALTVKSLVRHLPFGMPSTQYYFCDAPGCDVVYFPLYPEAPTFRREDLLVRIGAKETRDSIPVCYCFGITRNQIQEEIRKTGESTAAERVKAEVKAGRCACEVKNPAGKCCLGDIARTVKLAQESASANLLPASFGGGDKA